MRPYINGKRAFLLLNEFSAHKTQEVLSAFRLTGLQSFLIPGGFTHILQPLDVCVNKSVKDLMKAEWEIWFNKPNPIFTKSGNRQKPSYGELLQMVSNVYKAMKLKTDLISKVNSFC